MFSTVSCAMRTFWKGAFFFFLLHGYKPEPRISSVMLSSLAFDLLYLLMFSFPVAHRFLRHQRFENEWILESNSEFFHSFAAWIILYFLRKNKTFEWGTDDRYENYYFCSPFFLTPLTLSADTSHHILLQLLRVHRPAGPNPTLAQARTVTDLLYCIAKFSLSDPCSPISGTACLQHRRSSGTTGASIPSLPSARHSGSSPASPSSSSRARCTTSCTLSPWS